MPSDSLIGRRIGAYDVQERIGSGGMGQVYRAVDVRLGRPVAIKVLSDDPPADAESRHRFQDEARLASSLNHPHIVTVHDVGEIDGREYIVTEFVDGGTLTDWAAEHRTWEAILDLLIGVADALAAAHAAGVIHRDIKPANIMISRSGYAKLGDFGLAKLFPEAPTADAATVTLTRTRPGLIMGTIAYMSPEQAAGGHVDARSDIFSFGVVLYELLAGRRPFGGLTDLECLQAIIHRPAPPLPTNDPDIPLGLRSIVEKALEKDPASRYQTMRELVVDLRRLARPLAPGDSAAAPQRYAARIGVFLTLLAAGAIVALLWNHNGRPEPTAPLAIEQITAFSDYATQPALSSDGRLLAFIRGPGGFATSGQVYVKLLPGGEPKALTNDTTLKMMPVFSPDAERIAYTVVGAGNAWDTWVVPVLGAEARPWLLNASGLHWIAPGRLLFSEIKEGLHMALVTATESRTESRDVYVPESIRGMAHRSYLSPDGRSVLITEMDTGGMIPCRLTPFDGQSRGRVVGPPTGQCTHAGWSPDGNRMYFSSNANGGFQLWRQRFPDGVPEQLTFGPAEAEGLAVSPDGRSIVTSMGLTQQSVWVTENGRERQVSAEGQATLPAWGDGFPTSVFSADGKKLYYLVRAGVARGFSSGELWMTDLADGSRERLFPGLSITSYDVSPDGERVVFAAVGQDGKSRIWLARLDRRTPPAVLPPPPGALGPVFGSGDIVYYRGLEADIWYIFSLNVRTGNVSKFVAETAVNSPAVSPDRRWLLTTVPVAEKNSTTVQKAFPTAGGSPITICAGCFLRWPRDQRHLFFSRWEGSSDGSVSTYVIELAPGRALPDLPPGGISSAADLRRLRAVRVLDGSTIFPGPTASVYALERQSVQRNLYRVTLPQ